MKPIKYFDKFLILAIMLIAAYLVYVFASIDFDPDYTNKGHHDNAFNGYMIALICTFFWTVFIVGLFQVKYYLQGKERLYLVSFIFAGLSLYLLALTFLCFPMSYKEKRTIDAFMNFFVLIIPSLILLGFSWTKYVRNIHNQSKLNHQQELRKKLGI
ncbi:MAG: hypothetical protein QM710_00395 [Flavobacterium sp.]